VFQYLALIVLIKTGHDFMETLTSTSSNLPTVRIANRGPGLKLSSKRHEKWKKPNAIAKKK
jgi:hypothetical protein